MTNSAKLNELDQLVIGALLAHPRATQAQVGHAISSSEATVSRRMSRLFQSGIVRVTGVLDDEASHRARSLFVRLRCSPGAAHGAARRLAQWKETGSVKLLTGSIDCVAELSYTSNEHLLRLMMEELPRLDGVVATSSNQVIRRFSTPHSWNPGLLPEQAVEALHAERLDHWSEHPYPRETPPLSALDEQLVELLVADGRQGWQELARRCQVTPSTARRRVESLMSRGLLRMRTVIEPEYIGLPVNAFIWLSINPTQLGAAGAVLADHRDVLMIAATTGDRNLCGEIALASDAALYDFLSGTVGTLPGLLHADVAVGLRTIKRAAMILPHDTTTAPT
ncbi:Lrp/AsnC family transcriptional regulator [Phytoactinopolyspora halotolerans]|uniref:Lrp/AsnC family transcriptional regulator n=1 Tax=Phytoactinopolyspora halotolerans TaxID=1981512 RepID=A0A6L9S986_9ACTN|nr:Lrp/AsnC family transcriptional regulator [Phytoactinopolyspora halotolerans]NEE01261.1 Lrp/AsnC family transcriptional regulator [Phytoactinopolyspora halotolerans]